MLFRYSRNERRHPPASMATPRFREGQTDTLLKLSGCRPLSRSVSDDDTAKHVPITQTEVAVTALHLLRPILVSRAIRAEFLVRGVAATSPTLTPPTR